MQNQLLSTFFSGLLCTILLFALAFAAVLFMRLCVYYIKTNAPAAAKKGAKPEQPAAKAQSEPADETPAAPKRARPRRRVHTIEIRPDEINRIYVAEQK